MKYYYDLHIHSALSPCGDDDMTPNNIINMAKLGGLDIVALSDHNCCSNVEAASRVAKECDVVFLPAVEFETAEDIHVLCLFPDVDTAQKFDKEIITPNLPSIENNERIFGRQVIMDSLDNEIGIDSRYLINATAISISEIWTIVDGYGGIAIPAHIDKTTKSLISVLGMTDPSMHFKVFELSKNAPADFTDTQFSLKDMGYTYIYNSDAHYLCDIADGDGNNYFEFEQKPTAYDVINKLKNA